MYDRRALFLRVIMSTSHVPFCFPSVKKQKHDLQVLSCVQCMIKQLFDSVFCDIQNNQGLSKVISLSLRLITPTSMILDITNASANCQISYREGLGMSPSISTPSLNHGLRDAQNVCALTKVATVLKRQNLKTKNLEFKCLFS